MEVEVSLLGVFLAAVGAVAIGTAWYAKGAFGKDWMKLVKLDEKKAKQEMPKATAVAFFSAAITAYVLSHVSYLSAEFFGTSFASAALSSALWLWLGFQATHIVMNGTFEQKPLKLMAINAGSQLASLLTMAVILGFVGV